VSVAGAVPTTTASAPIVDLGTGQTNAASGAAQAAGVSSQNVVRNSSVAAVQVAGASSAPVKVQSSSVVNVGNVGSATAASGTAVALPVATPATPDVAALVPSAPTSPDISVGGLAIQNNVAGQTSSTTTLPGASAPSSPVLVSQVQRAAITSGSAATATSANVVSARTAAAGTSATTSGSITNAASGSTTALGVSAQNVVTTSANVDVQVGGQNFAPITVMIQTLTNILNNGVASAVSGTAAATGTQLVAPAGTTTGAVRQPLAAAASATSGNTSALGSTVTNQASLASSAVVHVAGNNHDPITLFLGLFITLTNWGFGSATSGSAQTSGGQAVASASVAGATTGSASATGLQATNDVDLQADALVRIDGSNFAPITVWVDMETTINNTGQAVAQSGDSLAIGRTEPRPGDAAAAAAGAAPRAGSAAAATPTASPTPTPLPASGVRLTGSVEMSSPSGSQGSSSLTARTKVDQAAAPPGQAPVQANSVPAAVAAPGIHAWAGDAACLGTSTDLAAANRQLSHVASQGGPGPGPSNASSYAISTQHDVDCRGGFAGANATPTPTAVPGASPASPAEARPQASAHPAEQASADTTTHRPGASGRTGSGGPSKSHSTILSDGLVGSIVGVSLDDAWPAADAPLMPVQTRRAIRGAGSGGGVGRSASGTGEPEDLPLPNQTIASLPPMPDQQVVSARASRAAGAAGSRQPAPGASPAAVADDSIAQPEAGDGVAGEAAPVVSQTGVLGTFIPLGPTAEWPPAEPVPLPDAVVGPHADAAADGALPVDPLAAAVAAVGALVLAASAARERRARVWLRNVRQRGIALGATLKLHARAAVRIGLGVLRIW
jgi:hypothetical protein